MTVCAAPPLAIVPEQFVGVTLGAPSVATTSGLAAVAFSLPTGIDKHLGIAIDARLASEREEALQDVIAVPIDIVGQDRAGDQNNRGNDNRAFHGTPPGMLSEGVNGGGAGGSTVDCVGATPVEISCAMPPYRIGSLPRKICRVLTLSVATKPIR